MKQIWRQLACCLHTGIPYSVLNYASHRELTNKTSIGSAIQSGLHLGEGGEEGDMEEGRRESIRPPFLNFALPWNPRE